MNLDAMRSYIRSVVDVDVTDISDDVLARMLAEGYDHIVYSKKRWPFFETEATFTTSSGVKDYSMDVVGAGIQFTHDGATVEPGIREIGQLRTDDRILEYIGRDDSDLMYPLDSESSGSPLYWAFWGDTVRLYPTPGSALTVTVRGYRNAAPFGSGVSGTATPDLPEPFQRLLTAYGLSRAYHQQEDPQMAQQYMGIFGAELDNLTARYDDSPAPQPLVLNAGTPRTRFGTRFGASGRLRFNWE